MENHNGDLNGFLKAEHLGKENYSPLLVQLLAQHNQAFARAFQCLCMKEILRKGSSLPGFLLKANCYSFA